MVRKMWNHYCPAEKTEMAIGDGEPCNWCGAEDAPGLIAGFEKKMNPRDDVTQDHLK